MTDFIQVTTAVANEDAARRIAEVLVERRLAACVQIVGPLRSVYRWQSAVEHAEELLLLIKTTGSRFEALERVIRGLHSYECPEIIATPITDGNMSYLRWLSDACGDEGGAKQPTLEWK